MRQGLIINRTDAVFDIILQKSQTTSYLKISEHKIILSEVQNRRSLVGSVLAISRTLVETLRVNKIAL